MTSNLSADEKNERKQLFGGFHEGLQSVKPYLWELGDRRLLEIPVTTMPIFKIPIHFSYLLYMSTHSSHLARTYFRTALAVCQIADVEPSLLLHPLDFLGESDVPGLEFFPAMKRPHSEKGQLLTWAFKTMSSSRVINSVGRHAVQIQRQRVLRKVRPNG
jgi:hypothetical protein